MLLKGLVFSCTPSGYQIYGAQISHLLGDFLDVQRAITTVAPNTSNDKIEELQIPKQNEVPNVQINRIVGDIKELFMGQCICLASQETQCFQAWRGVKETL